MEESDDYSIQFDEQLVIKSVLEYDFRPNPSLIGKRSSQQGEKSSDSESIEYTWVMGGSYDSDLNNIIANNENPFGLESDSSDLDDTPEFEYPAANIVE